MINNETRNDLGFYLNLHYPVTIYEDPEGGFVAEVEDLPGCVTQGETMKEVFEAIEDARKGWLQIAYENGQGIPLPRGVEEYSGKILIRIPRSLHRVLIHAAKREGVSLNQYINSLLSGGVQEGILKQKVDAALSSVS